jgi:hypothetical protein
MIRQARCGVNREEAEAGAVGQAEAVQVQAQTTVFAA